MKISFLDALLSIDSNAQASISGKAGEEDISTLIWENGYTPIDTQTILDKQSELQTIEDNS